MKSRILSQNWQLDQFRESAFNCCHVKIQAEIVRRIHVNDSSLRSHSNSVRHGLCLTSSQQFCIFQICQTESPEYLSVTSFTSPEEKSFQRSHGINIHNKDLKEGKHTWVIFRYMYWVGYTVKIGKKKKERKKGSSYYEGRHIFTKRKPTP
jgi:hypothetical protein